MAGVQIENNPTQACSKEQGMSHGCTNALKIKKVDLLIPVFQPTKDEMARKE